MRVSGVASNAFQPCNCHGTIPLSFPPQGDFNSFTELKKLAQDHCKLACWAIVEGKGSEKRQGRYLKYLVCKHFGKIAISSGVGKWFLSLRYMEGKTQHNHEVHDPSAYFEHRRLSSSQLALIKTNHASGIPASRTKSALERTNPELILTSRDIYSKTAQIERRLLQGKESNQALIDELNTLKAEGKILFEISINEVTRRIEKLFLADTREQSHT